MVTTGAQRPTAESRDSVRRRALVAVALVSAVGAGCSEEREPAAIQCLTWQEDIAPVFAERCGSCHGDSAPDGDYSVADYLSVLGAGSDHTANAIAGDAESLLVTVLAPATATASHVAVTDLHDRVRRWVVECHLGYLRSSVHGAGLMNPTDPTEFHGAVVGAVGWDLRVCQKCHGDDYRGGTAEASCTTCHAGTPEDCSTCHGFEPATGSHPAHLGAGPQGKQFDCTQCHPAVESYASPGHVLFADGTPDPPPAEIVFGALANLDPLGQRVAPASHDTYSGTCRNVYCHGGGFADRDATRTRPVWGGEPDQAACGTCHGLGPRGHTVAQCSFCHQGVASDDLVILDPGRHVDGIIQAPAPGCSGCHGADESGAPPPDLAGNTATTALGVGAHQGHLGANLLRGPIPCSDCHLVPAEVAAVGHLDPDRIAEVFPDVEGFSSRARARGATPVWNRDTATCSGVYCHGGAPVQSSDAAPGLDRTPQWTAVGSGEAACGSCHGLPPTTGFHDPGLTLADCHTCHPQTVDESGAIILTGAPGAERSQHIDGTVDTF